MQKAHRILAGLVATVCSLAGTACFADDDWLSPLKKWDWTLPESVQIHGFASQSYLHTSANNFFGHSSNMGSLDFTEMGINGSWRPLPQLQTSMQVVYRRAGRTDNQDLRIDFGFLDYTFLANSENQVGVRAGRVVNPYGLYNDTRDMPFTRPSILLPQSIYFDVDRNFALSGDGVQLYGENHSAFGDFYLQVNGIYSRASDPTLVDAIKLGLPGNVNGEPSFVGRLMYEWDQGRVRLGITSADLNASYNPPRGLEMLRGKFNFTAPVLLSAQYNAELWSLTSEYSIRNTSRHGFDSPSTDSSGESYYFQGSYRFAEGWESYLRYDVYYVDQSDRSGKEYATLTGLPAYTQFAKDLTFGLRWDVTSWCMLRAEYHHINGVGWISYLENTNPEDIRQYWDMFGVSASFRF